MVEEFTTQRRRIKKASVLSVGHDSQQRKTCPPIGHRFMSQRGPPRVEHWVGPATRHRQALDDDSPNFMKPTRQMIICKVCRGATQYKSFARERSARSGPSSTQLVFHLCVSSMWGSGRKGSACFDRAPRDGR
ncbi:hypothetical protein PoB_001438800 [Plakobranchus ocellatus]|uniref:Uncharacterized protein n=1 Tax=Plakobranchus ocellatus TaxID=259542 RepID=A0AAV3YZT9_9GAST|nr:hypothetical protein PoB_001438800 [Plakobranchus ocellatus]